MPRTPGPLTLRYDATDEVWLVEATDLDALSWWQASFKREANARAFVALPALIKTAKQALSWMSHDDLGVAGQEVYNQLQAALAQADGPSQEQG